MSGGGLPRLARTLLATGLLGHATSASAVEEDLVGYWIYAGSVRDTLVARFLGPEGLTPGTAAVVRAGRGCGLPVRVDRLSEFRETPPGAEPLVFGPFLDPVRAAAALACVRRHVPTAFVTQAVHSGR